MPHRTPLLTALRACAQPSPRGFLRLHPGCWVVMRPDDLAVTRYRPALWRSLDQEELERLQGQGWGAHFSAQAFGPAFCEADLLCARTLVLDLVIGSDSEGLTPAALDRRKEQALRRIATFPLRPHWLIETRLGLQSLYRVRPEKARGHLGTFLALQDGLDSALGGAGSSGLLGLVRLPGTLEFAPSGPPSLCRLLEDHSASVPPYTTDEVAGALGAPVPRRTLKVNGDALRSGS